METRDGTRILPRQAGPQPERRQSLKPGSSQTLLTVERIARGADRGAAELHRHGPAEVAALLDLEPRECFPVAWGVQALPGRLERSYLCVVNELLPFGFPGGLAGCGLSDRFG